MGAEIIIKIKKGKISIDVEGVEDATCADITQALEQALGEAESVQEKPEFFCELENTEQYVEEE